MKCLFNKVKKKFSRKGPKGIIVHCAATPASMDIGAEEIRDWHVNGNEWSDIGYHFVVRRNGRIEKGRSISPFVNGAHCKGKNNYIGICWVGGRDAIKDMPTERQYDALLEKICGLMDKFNFKIKDVRPHSDFANKACPNLISWEKFIIDLEVKLNDG